MTELGKLPPSILSVNRTWDLLTHKERNNVCRTWGQQLRPGCSLSHRISMEPGPQFPESSFYTQTAENMSYVDLSFLPCPLGHSDGSGLDGLSVPIGYSLTLLVTRNFPRGPSPCLRGLKPACIHPMFLKASTSGRGHRLSRLMDQCPWRVRTGSGYSQGISRLPQVLGTSLESWCNNTTVPRTQGLQLSSHGDFKSRWWGGKRRKSSRHYCPIGDEQPT